ncbi:MAG: sigma-70 family RNA polymerase sigma factor [Ardenticatenales bacterium]
MLTRRIPAPAGGLAVVTRSRPIDAGALYAAHARDVFRAAFRVTGNVQDAEDVLQTVFARLMRSADAADLDNPAGYLHRAAVNAALDLLRQRRRRATVSLDGATGDDAAPQAFREMADPNIDPDDRALRDALRAAVAELPARTGQIFALRYFEGYSNRQIADRLDTTENSIGVTLHRARARMRAAMTPWLAD